MFGVLLFIALSLIILAGFIFYINKRNNETDNFLISELKHLREIKNKVVNHLTNSLTEVDYLNMKYKYLGTSNSDSVCYKNKDTKIDNCECHPSCKTCGYSDNPIGMNQCLVCKNGTEVNKLYENGAGWCSSYQLDSGNYEHEEKDENETEDDSDDTDDTSNTDDTSELEEKTKECINKFKTICPTSSDWKDCLELNKQSLILSGCQIQLGDDGSITANYSPVQPTTGDNEEKSDTEQPPTITKYELKKGDELKEGEHLVSSNSKFYLRVEKSGSLLRVNNTTNAKNYIFKLDPPAEHLGPYALKFRMSNTIALVNKDGEVIWSIRPENIIDGPNTKFFIADTGIVIFKDNNENIRWRSNNTSGETGDSAGGTDDSSSSDTDDEEKKPEPHQFADPVFGVLKFSKCPEEYPYKAKTIMGSGLACSKEENATATRDNACAVKGFRTGSGTALLPRCYPNQVGLDPNTGKYVKCPEESSYPGPPVLNRYVMWQGRRSKKIKCKKRKDNTNKYRSGPTPIEVTNFQDI